jgi:phosphoadenosine phosphosulfate reductase
LKEVEDYLTKKRVPAKRIAQKKDFSIGCAPCTRAIAEGEDIRAGRWWWNQVIKNAALHQG